MCGISVVLGPAPDPGIPGLVGRLHAKAAHRGPDGEGFLLVDATLRADALPALDAPVRGEAPVLGFGFRRLRIRDLSDAAHQPMGSPDGSCWIVFNGEIDNFRELRRELEAGGRRFRSTGDTEVALAAFEAWGDDCFRRFEGMWAIAVADLRGRRLVCSRDRFGIKPLYWALDEGRLLLASEAKQILNARTGPVRPHAPALARFLRGTRLPGLDDTFFSGVRAVPPATWFALPLDGPVGPPEFRAYWSLADFRCPDPRRPRLAYGEALRALEDTLSEVVASQDVADVTVGCLLSGGLDSATVTALLARHRGPQRPPRTFSFGVRGSEPSELPQVDGLIARTGWPNVEAGLDAAWIAAHAAAAVRAVEEPPLSSAVLAQHRVYQACREHGATVVLDGHAADEVFAGYPYHQRTLLHDRLRTGRFSDLLRETRAIARAHGVGVAAVLREAARPLFARAPPSPWLAAGYGDDADAAERRAAQADRGQDPARLNRQLYRDVKWGNAKIVAAFSDKNAMAHSVEARVPFLDRRVVELAFGLPDHYKVADGQRKRVLRDVARGLLPPEITDRPDRMGFPLPQTRLLREAAGALDGLVRAALGAPCLVAAEAERTWSGFMRGDAGDAGAAWRLAAFALWTHAFDVRFA
jgi:asparagine synthase (glutamine-hydrolysing)